jgi:hypothetical protein
MKKNSGSTLKRFWPCDRKTEEHKGEDVVHAETETYFAPVVFSLMAFWRGDGKDILEPVIMAKSISSASGVNNMTVMYFDSANINEGTPAI